MQWLFLRATLVLGVLGLTGWVALDARHSVGPELRNSIPFDRSALPASGEVRACNHIDDNGIGHDV